MPVYQNKNAGKWDFRYYSNDVYGIRKQFQQCGFTTKREAQAAERKFLDQNTVGDESILFSKLWDEYNEYIKLKQKKQSYRTTVSKFKNHILSYFENFKLDSISAVNLDLLFYNISISECQ